MANLEVHNQKLQVAMPMIMLMLVSSLCRADTVMAGLGLSESRKSGLVVEGENRRLLSFARDSLLLPVMISNIVRLEGMTGDFKSGV